MIDEKNKYYKLGRIKGKLEAYNEILELIQQPYNVPIDFKINQKIKELKNVN